MNITCWGVTGGGCIGSPTPGSWLASGDGGATADGTFYGNTKDGFKAEGYINTDLFTDQTRKISYNEAGFTDPYTGEDWTAGGSLRQWQLYIWNTHGASFNTLAKKISDNPGGGQSTWRVYTNPNPGTTVSDVIASTLYPKKGNKAYWNTI